MIESSILCSSSWDSDLFHEFDAEMPPISEFEDSINNFEKDSSKLSSSCTSPNDLSCCSSDYESLAFEDFDNILPDNIFPVADSFISQILEESNSIDYNDLDYQLFDASESCNLPIDNSVSLKDSPKKAETSLGYLSSKSWSKMSPEEQLKTLHTLSEIVTCHMGIREQIEVIKIIDPSVTISPDDKEFALDSSSLNDSKMKRIREFVQQHGFCISNSKKFNSSSTNSFTSNKRSVSSRIFSRKASSRTKRRQKKQKTSTDEDIRQKRKLELHGKKEAQSGLFVYEKIIKKLSNPLEEDEDVNILE